MLSCFCCFSDKAKGVVPDPKEAGNRRLMDTTDDLNGRGSKNLVRKASITIPPVSPAPSSSPLPESGHTRNRHGTVQPCAFEELGNC